MGDSWNDISMFGRADVPCAMVGAPGDVIEAAGGRTTPSVAAFTAAPLSQVAGLGVTSMPLHIPVRRAAAALARGLEETVDGISCTRSTGFVDVTAAGGVEGGGPGPARRAPGRAGHGGQ